MVLKFSNFLKIKVSYYSSKYKQYLCHVRDSHTPLIGRDKWRRERSSLIFHFFHPAILILYYPSLQSFAIIPSLGLKIDYST